MQGFAKGPVKRHGCPSHGIGLTPDEKEALGHRRGQQPRAHLRRHGDAARSSWPAIELRDEPGWITFSVDGQYAYPSTGDVIDVKSRNDRRHA